MRFFDSHGAATLDTRAPLNKEKIYSWISFDIQNMKIADTCQKPKEMRLAKLVRGGMQARLLRRSLVGTRGSVIGSRLFSSGEEITVTFVEDGEDVEATVRVGQSILEAAHENEIELEGACDAQLACSTCHVILPQEIYDGLEEPCEEEMDMLDLAIGVEDTSRLGCQVKISKDMNGMRIIVPQSLDLR
ncbi:hypothetical protein AAMO2058_001179300 [Amorphochlora amoebiformis]